MNKTDDFPRPLGAGEREHAETDLEDATIEAPSPQTPDVVLATLFAAWFLLAAPVVTIIPRATPVWTITLTLIAAARLYRGAGWSGLRPRATPATLGAAALFLLALASVAWSPSPRSLPTALEIGYTMLGALLIGRLVVRVSRSEIERIRRLFLIGVGAGLLVWAFNLVFEYPVHRLLQGLEAGTVIGSNVAKRTADALVLLLWPAAAALTRGRTLWIVLLVPMFFILETLAGGSRSALAGAAVGLVVFGCASISATATRRILVVALLALLVGSVPAASWLGGETDARRSEWLFPSARHRIDIWRRAADRVPEAPIVGLGIDASRAQTPRPGELTLFDAGSSTLLPLHPHNATLQLWFELGGIGATLATALMIGIILAAGRLPPTVAPFALAQCAAGALMANTAYGLWQAWWMSAYLASGLVAIVAARTSVDSLGGDAAPPHETGDAA